MNMNPYAELPAGFGAATGVVYALLLVLMLVTMWKIFVKMGRPGWEGIIPVYNLWVLVKMLKKPQSWFWILLIGGVLITLMQCYIAKETAVQMAADTYMSGALIFVSLLAFVVAIVVLVYSIKIYHALSKAFGHGVGFTIGLVLLSIVFLPILAFGKSRFLPAGR